MNITIRQELDLYACLRPVRVLPQARDEGLGIDLVVVRENTEDVYSGLEYPAGSPGPEQWWRRWKSMVSRLPPTPAYR
ncbi:isocitrate/isopropylmalate family dehydrogenase [Streptomyces sp. M10(2022)]